MDNEQVAENPQEKLFTHEEVRAIIQQQFEQGKYHTEEEWNELSGQRDTALGQVNNLTAELEQAKRERYVYSKGFTSDEAEFIAFKAAKLVDENTTFEAAVDLLAENTAKSLEANRGRPSFNWTASVGGNRSLPKSQGQIMNDLIRGAARYM